MQEDVEEQNGIVLSEARTNLIARVIDVGQPITEEQKAIARVLRPGLQLVLPRIKAQMYDNLIAVKLEAINIIVDEED